MAYFKNNSVVHTSTEINSSLETIDFIRIENCALGVTYDAHYPPEFETNIRGATVPMMPGMTFFEIAEKLERKLHIMEGSYVPWPLARKARVKSIEHLARAIARAKGEIDQILEKGPVEMGFEADEAEEEE